MLQTLRRAIITLASTPAGGSSNSRKNTMNDQINFTDFTVLDPDFIWCDPESTPSVSLGNGEVMQAWITPHGLLFSQGLGAETMLVPYSGDLATLKFLPQQ